MKTGAGSLFIDGTSDILNTYVPRFPPAGTVTIGTAPNQCGDVQLTFTGLNAGNYLVLLSDAEYYPVAVSELPGLLGGRLRRSDWRLASLRNLREPDGLQHRHSELGARHHRAHSVPLWLPNQLRDF